MLVVYTFGYFVFIDFILQLNRSGIVTCRYVISLHFIIVGFKKLGSAYVEFIFLDVKVCWFWRVNCVGVSVIFVVICVL